jgi:hypothetical protein
MPAIKSAMTVLSIATALVAQEYSHFTPHISAGASVPLGITAKYSDTYWMFAAGAGYRWSPRQSISLEYAVPLPVPAKLFWSVTVYDAGSRSQVQTRQNKAALRSLFELKDVKADAAELFFGPNAPAGKDGQWIQTIPAKGWFDYFRIYRPEKAAFDATWKPGDLSAPNWGPRTPSYESLPPVFLPSPMNDERTSQRLKPSNRFWQPSARWLFRTPGAIVADIRRARTDLWDL